MVDSSQFADCDCPLVQLKSVRVPDVNPRISYRGLIENEARWCAVGVLFFADSLDNDSI